MPHPKVRTEPPQLPAYAAAREPVARQPAAALTLRMRLAHDTGDVKLGDGCGAAIASDGDVRHLNGAAGCMEGVRHGVDRR